jgi:hypothetical protein
MLLTVKQLPYYIGIGSKFAPFLGKGKYPILFLGKKIQQDNIQMLNREGCLGNLVHGFEKYRVCSIGGKATGTIGIEVLIVVKHQFIVPHSLDKVNRIRKKALFKGFAKGNDLF